MGPLELLAWCAFITAAIFAALMLATDRRDDDG